MDAVTCIYDECRDVWFGQLHILLMHVKVDADEAQDAPSMHGLSQ